MRTYSHPMLAPLLAGALALAALPATAQESEEFIAPDGGAPLSGYTRSDGTVVLSDGSFCRLLLGALWGDQRLTFVDLLDRTKNQRKARRGAISPGSDETVVARCVEVLSAARNEAPEDDTLPGWIRRSPVVPEALSGLLPDDFVAQPLAQPEAVGDAARTSGFGSLVSAPFSVTPGPWLAELDAASCDVWEGTLRDARDPQKTFPLQDDREYLYELGAGHYYWDVTASECDWSVDLVPVELGPVPTPTPRPRVAVPALHGTDWRGHFETFLTATQAREALLAAGLVVGECVEQEKDSGGGLMIDPSRVWDQDPIPGALVEPGSAVDVWMVSDCDVLRGDRVVLEE